MANLTVDDSMDWTPTRETVVLHQSAESFNQPIKRKLDHISGGIDSFGRMQQPDDVRAGSSSNNQDLPHHQSYPQSSSSSYHTGGPVQSRHWLHPFLLMQQYFLSVVLCTFHGADKAYTGAKRRWFSRLSPPVTPLPRRRPTASHRKGRRSPSVGRNVCQPPIGIPGAFPTTPTPLHVHYESPEVQSLSVVPAFSGPALAIDTSIQRPSDLIQSTESGPPAHQIVPAGRPVRLFSELDDIGSTFCLPRDDAPLPPEVPIPPTKAVLKARSTNIVTPSAYETPVKARKSVVFAVSPRTGRPVTQTKRYVIGEAIDYPTPSSIESSYNMETPSLNAPPTPSPLSSYDPALLSIGLSPMSGFSSDSEDGAHYEIPLPVPSSNGSSPVTGFSQDEETESEQPKSSVLAIPLKGSSPLLGFSSDACAGYQFAQARDAASSSNGSSPSVGFSQDGAAGTGLVQAAETKTEATEGTPTKQASKEILSASTSSATSTPSTTSNPFETPIRRKSSPDLSKEIAQLDISPDKPEGLGDSGRRRSDRHRRKSELEELAKARKAEEARLQEIKRKKELEEQIRREGLRRFPKTPAIPPLSAEAQNTVAEALKKGMQTKVALTNDGTAITRRDIGKVLPQRGTTDDASGWLNDEIITAYLQMIVEYGHTKEGHKRNATPKYHAFNAFFYTNLKNKGYDSVKRWAKKAKIGGKDLLNADHIFIPVNQSGNHWTMAIVSPKNKRIEYFDSLHFSSATVYQNIRKWLKGELGAAYKAEEWTDGEEEGRLGQGYGPSQSNGSDCGVFAVTTAKMVLLGINPHAVSPRDMQLQRWRIVAEILNGGFSGEFEPHVEFD